MVAALCSLPVEYAPSSSGSGGSGGGSGGGSALHPARAAPAAAEAGAEAGAALEPTPLHWKCLLAWQVRREGR